MTRSLLGVFEEDATAISNYMNQLYQAMHRIYDAQNELSAATHLTSKLLKEYEKQRFPLGGDDEVMSSTLQQFSKVIDEVKYEVTEDVYTSRKKQHQTMMHYFCALNTLQYKKKIALLEPLLGYMQAQISFFKMGSENLNGQLEEFLANIGTSVQNKTGLVSSTWDRQFYFTQGGNLMSQARGDVAGGLAMDIDNCSVMAVDCEDRRYCFQITSFDGKKSSILQAESKKDHEEVIIGKHFYSTDSILHQLFIVRFLGSMEVKADDHPDVVYETMRQILAARAIHNIFRMTESHLLVTCDCLKLIDPQTQVTRLTICDSVGLAKQIALHAELDRRASEKQKEIERVKEKQQKELSKQKQIEKDLEEQSRLIAASSRPNQAGSEGQLVLSSSQSEESDLGEEGKKRESEA
ncbi:DCC-interacting protein 13-alpha [Cricetulus griseus]|nr:DCC-interacting protein 13-alpha [Cricetulus griseus]